MNKKRKWLIATIICFGVIILILGGYLVYDKVLSGNKDVETNVKDDTKKEDTTIKNNETKNSETTNNEKKNNKSDVKSDNTNNSTSVDNKEVSTSTNSDVTTNNEVKTVTFHDMTFVGDKLLEASGYAGANSKALLLQGKTAYFLKYDGDSTVSMTLIGTDIVGIGDGNMKGYLFVYIDDNSKLNGEYNNYEKRMSQNDTFIEIK